MHEAAEFPAADLPAWPTSFVGRETEVARVGQALVEERFVTLTGAGGCGKTRLAAEAAARVVEGHRDRVRWVDLTPAWTTSLVAYDVARAFRLVAEGDRRPIITTLCEHLNGSDALLVVDHCDSQIERCAELVDMLLKAAPELQVLATSRQPLGVMDEVALRVPPLDTATARQLFVERATAAEPKFGSEDETGDAVGDICRRLDGVPLAIELAAARVRTMSPARIAAGLGTSFRARSAARRTAPSPQETMETAIVWSYGLLEGTERTLLRRLSVFASGFTLESAEDISAAVGLEHDVVAPALSRLIDYGLVEKCPRQDEGRYRLPETIRERATATLVDAGESDAIRDRHRDYFVAFAERAESELVQQDGPQWLDRLERERHNFVAVAEWCESTGAYDSLLRLLTALTLFFELRQHAQAGGRWFARALASEGGPSQLRVRALWGAARLALYNGDVAALGRHAAEALAMAETLGDEASLCRALNINGAATAWFTSNVAGGRDLLERSTALGRKLGDDLTLVEGLRLSALARMVQGDYTDVGRSLAELRSVAERLGNRFQIVWYHTIVGWARLQGGDFPRARRALEMALEEDRQMGGSVTAGIAAALLGEVDAVTGRYEEAETRLVPFLRSGAAECHLGTPWALPALGRLLVGLGRPGEAGEIIEPLLAALRRLGAPLHLAEALLVLGIAHAGVGSDGAAKAALHEARTIATAINNAWLTAHVDHHLAEVARRRGDMVGAADLHRRALAARAPAGLRPGVAESLEAIAALVADRGRYVDGARLFSAAAGLRRGMGLARWPVDQPRYDTDVTGARRALGDSAFQIAWAEGAALGFDDAVAYGAETG